MGTEDRREPPQGREGDRLLLAELGAGKALPIQPLGSGIRVDVFSGGDSVARAMNTIVRKMTLLTPAGRHRAMSEVAHALRLAAGAQFASHAQW